MRLSTVIEHAGARRRVQMTPHARVLHASVRLACAIGAGGEEAQAPAAAATDLRAALAAVTDWDALRQAAIDHGLSALLYRQISAFCPESVPPAPLDALKSLYLASSQRALRMTRQLVHVLAVLKAAGIRALPLKGPPCRRAPSATRACATSWTWTCSCGRATRRPRATRSSPRGSSCAVPPRDTRLHSGRVR